MRIDPHVMAEVAGRFSISADAVTRAAAVVSASEFAGAAAGRDYAAQGDAVHAGLVRLSRSLDAWAAATRTVGRTLADDLSVFGAAEDDNRADLAGLA